MFFSPESTVARLPTPRLLVILLGLCAWRSGVTAGQELPPPRSVDEKVVLAIDGSGLLRGIGDDLRQAAIDAQQPLAVETFAWSHGAGRILADLHDHDYQKSKGQELADTILACHQMSPVGKVYLVCHSAGAAVVLAAAQQLPEGSVDRIVFLAPALAPTCDLRPALRCARRGLDSFHSPYDMISGVVLAVMGNADGQFITSAGCFGFTAPRDDNGVEDPLYARLQQHGWEWEMSKTGNFGGHFGCTRGSFLREYIVPLLKGE
jgi:pimeloyl-ACP methyl ester carboxylesterase